MLLTLDYHALLNSGLLCRLALFAQAKLAEPLPRVDAVVVAVAEHELHAVAADVFGTEHRKVVGDRSRIEYTKSGHFTHAVGAQALRPQILDRVDTHVAVVPSDRDLVRASFLYLEWVRHRGCQWSVVSGQLQSNLVTLRG